MNAGGRLGIATVAAVTFVLSTAVYGSSLSSQPWTGDTAEYQTVPYILGIAHPTGFPAYTLAGWAWSHALAFGTVAWRMNALSALCTALTVAAVALLALALEAGVFAAAAAALTFAFGTVVWRGATLASSHALSGLFIVTALAASVAFARDGDRRKLFAACACVGLGMATHPEAIWVLPALLVAALWQRRVLQPRALAVSATLVLAPLLLYGYLPIRSAVVAAQHLDPTAAAPIFGVGSFDWDYNHPRMLNGFLDEVLGRGAGAGPAVVHAFGAAAISRAGPLWSGYAGAEFDLSVLLLAAVGCGALALRDRRALSVLVAGTAGGVLFASAYSRDVELYRYFLVSSAAIAALAAAATRFPLPRIAPAAVAGVVTFALILTAGLAWYDHRGPAASYRYLGAQATIDAVRADVPDGAIIVTNWYDAPTLGYGAFIEHALGNRTVVHAIPDTIAAELPALTRARRLFLFGWGTEIADDTLPPEWLHEKQTSLRGYRLVEVSP